MSIALIIHASNQYKDLTCHHASFDIHMSVGYQEFNNLCQGEDTFSALKRREKLN